MQEKLDYTFLLKGKSRFKYNAGVSLISYDISIPQPYKNKIEVVKTTLGNSESYINVYEFYNKSNLSAFISLYDKKGLIKFK